MAIDGGDGGDQYAVGGKEREKAAGEGGIGGGLVDPGGGRRAAGRGGGGGGGRGRDVVEAEDATDEGGEGDGEEGAALVGGMAPEEGVDGGAGGGDLGRRHGGQDGGGQVLGPVLRIHRLGFWERGRSGEREAFGVRRFKTEGGSSWDRVALFLREKARVGGDVSGNVGRGMRPRGARRFGFVVSYRASESSDHLLG